MPTLSFQDKRVPNYNLRTSDMGHRHIADDSWARSPYSQGRLPVGQISDVNLKRPVTALA